jgi:hypothetical protein
VVAAVGVVYIEVRIRTRIVLSIIQGAILIGFSCSLNPMTALVPTTFGWLESEGMEIWCPTLIRHALFPLLANVGGSFLCIIIELINLVLKFHLQQIQCTVQSQKHQFSSFSITSKIVIDSGFR